MATRISQTERLTRSHELLHALMEDAREMLQESPDEENTRWMFPVVDKMVASLHEAFQLKENQSYLADVLEQYPEWQPQVLRLQDEHRLLEGQLRQLRDHLELQAATGRLSAQWQEQFKDWLQAFVEHEHRESALVQEAFILDVGQGE